MADNFDLKKFLKESKALENLNPSLKAINEEESREERANVDKYEYEKGKKAGKREGMKAKIKDMIVAELGGEIDDDPDAKLNADYDPVYEGENGPAYRGPEGYDDASDSYTDEEDNEYYDNEYGDSNDFGDTDEFDGYGGLDIDEAKKKEADVEDVEVTDTEVEDMPAEDEMPAEDAPEATGGIEDIAADMKGTEADLMDHLMKSFQIAKGMNNEKLETQVGNTLKFFVSEYIGGGE
jgi:hypothetical protein